MKQILQKMKQYVLVVLLVLIGNYGWGQTNPSAFDLGSSNFTFSTQTSSSSTYPTNIQGWTTGINNLVGITTNAPSADQSLVSSGSASTSGLSNLGSNGFNFLSTSSSPNRQVGAICIVLNTTGRSNILVSWLADDQTSGTTREMNITLQYRIGVSGVFTTVSGSTYSTSNNSNKLPQSFDNISLPVECENQSILQLRWITYESVSQTGGRDAIRLDDISISSTPSSSNTISTGTLTGAPFCVDGTNGAAGTIAYTYTGTYNGTFTAQLSDANGSFDSPVAIGTGTSPIAVNIPAGTALGSGYRVRVVNNDPATVGSSSTAFSVINTPPTLTTPTSTSITTSTAILGGNVTGVGCNTITERGIYYSTTIGFADGDGIKVSETSGPYSTGTFTVNVTGLTSGTTYYYKAFATSASGTSYTTQGTFSTLKIEPANHPTNFVATSVTTGAIVPQWTASVAGSQAPDGYLIKASTTTVVDPVDGTDPANSTSISSGSANRKVTPGSATTGSTFTGMTSGTMYNYKIYPYTNTGTSIDFKITDAPSFSHATLPTAPTALVASSVQETSATLTWTPGTFNASNDFLVFVKSSSTITSGSPTFAPSNYTANPIFGQGTVYQNDVNAFCVYKGDATTVNISGLNPNETYHVAVYKVVEASNSDGTNSYSTVLIGNFLTLTNPVTVPYAQDFENATSEWVLNSLGTNKWSIGSATQNGGSKALYISNDGGVSNAYMLTSTQDTYASIRADLSGLTNATLTFDWKSNGELFNGSIYDYGEVYINTGGSDVLISGAKEFYNTTTFAQKNIDISAYTGSIVTIKFRWVNDNADGNQPPFAVDNVAILPYGFPDFTTSTVTSITNNSAISGAAITSDGGSSITNRGIVYATTANPTTSNFVISDGSGTGTFTANLSGLLSNTTYYVRAFVTTTNGTYYANEVSFTTTNIAAPLALNATGVGATSFTATWDAVPGATGYEIDVYESQSGGLASNLILSEYGEGSGGSKKYIEIFNGTGSIIDLSNYQIWSISNGGSWPESTISLTGTLANNGVYVIANNSTDVIGADLYNSTTSLNFNGNDAIGIAWNGGAGSNYSLIDAIGDEVDPGTGWNVAGTSNATTDKILIRKSSIKNPTTNWVISAGTNSIDSQWEVSSFTYNATNQTTNLGSHTFNPLNTIYSIQNFNVGNVTSYQVTGLDQNTTYYYVVRALDATSESVNSNEITTTTALVSTTWNGTTWSNGAPTSTVDAIIDGDFTSTGNLIAKDVTINATRTLTINAADQLSVMGNLVNNGAILFKSDATSTGRFDSYTGNAITGSGTVTMERYIDGKRAYRLLAPGVTTTGTIENNWQQQVFITGSTTGANGFDATTTGNPSMYTYENSGWAPISNTNVLTLDATKGYRMLIRGDRTPSLLTSPSEANMNTAVTLTATGSLVTGDVIFTTLPSQDYTLVGNPYVSPIDWATVTKNDIAPTYYVWDPNLGTVGQRGRYVSCDEAGLTSIVSGSGSPSSAVNAFIQPGQAFFIEKAISGTPGSITVKETDKAATFTDVFRTNSAPTITTIEGKLGMNLYESLAYSLGDYPIDGAVAVSGTAFNTASANDDAKKLMSHGEQVAFVRENKQLGVEKVSPPQLNDVLTLATLNLVPNKNYVWSVVLQDNFSNENSYLYDAFTQTYHSLTASGTTVVSFATTADVTSTQANRFKIVFQTSVLSAPDFTNEIVVYPNPAKVQNAVCYVKGISNATVALHNVLGQNIPIQTTTDGTTLTLRPTVALNKGIYVVHIAQDGTIKQVKWIVD